MIDVEKRIYHAMLTRDSVADYLEQLAENISSSSITLESGDNKFTMPISRIVKLRLVTSESPTTGHVGIEVHLSPLEDVGDERHLIF